MSNDKSCVRPVGFSANRPRTLLEYAGSGTVAVISNCVQLFYVCVLIRSCPLMNIFPPTHFNSLPTSRL